MIAPSWFEELLQREFKGELRIRWSNFRREWHIEQRVGRATSLPSFGDPDRALRAREGYAFHVAIQPGLTRPCPDCRWPMEVGELRFMEARCGYCGYVGKSGRRTLAFFPLNEKLIEHLKRNDPTRDYLYKHLQELDLHNQRVEAQREAANQEERYDALTDVALSQIPSVGYTGKEIYGS
jgi:hypothetical protein